jgi:hypothetical protein
VTPEERVSTCCEKSQFKDNHHDWYTVMYENHYVYCTSRYEFFMKKCLGCGLHVLLYGLVGDYTHGPKRTDKVIHAFFKSEIL